MTAVRALIAFAALAAASSAQAQTWPPPAGLDAHRYQADRHRYEMDRLRARADQRETFARQLQLETRATRIEIEAARQPEPVAPAARALRSPEEERARRRAAEERRLALANRVGQIDAWLDNR